jgi:hypothetical protein
MDIEANQYSGNSGRAGLSLNNCSFRLASIRADARGKRPSVASC